MNLGYKDKFPDGTPTLFREKILLAAKDFSYPWTSKLSDEELDLHWEKYKDLRPKLHTIRADEKDLWVRGNTIHHVYNNRQKNRDCFLVGKCILTQKITIMTAANVVEDSDGKPMREGTQKLVLVDGKFMNADTLREIALNDGFSSVEHFFTWFHPGFQGKIIHSTNLRY